MLSYIWPIILVLFSNTLYQICVKSIPDKMNPFASLTVTYVVSAVFSGILYFILNKDANLFKEYNKINLAPVMFGLVLVGLEVGWIYAYRAGWEVSKGFIVQSSILAVILIFVGYLLYKENITWNKIIGIIICLIGLAFINLK